MKNKVEYIIVHHTQRNNDFPAFIRLRHIYLRKWDDIGYHYLIGNKRPFTRDGHIYVGRSEDSVGAHALGYNDKSLGICLIGNLDKTAPSLRQIRSLVRLLKEKTRQYRIPSKNILGHRELPEITKSCPGYNLDMDIVRQVAKEHASFSEILIHLMAEPVLKIESTI